MVIKKSFYLKSIYKRYNVYIAWYWKMLVGFWLFPNNNIYEVGMHKNKFNEAQQTRLIRSAYRQFVSTEAFV